LRRGLGGGEPSPVLFERGWMELNRAYVWDVDLDRFEMLVRSAGEDPEPLRDALTLLRGEPLIEDRYDDWALPVRDRVLRLWREAGLRLARKLETAGDHEAAITWLEMLLDHDPLDEEVVQSMLRNLVAAGHRGEALRRYQAFAERLQEELAVEPEEETRTLLAVPAANGEVRPAQTAFGPTLTVPAVTAPTQAPRPSRLQRLLYWLSPLAIALLVALPVIVLLRPASAISHTELSIYNAQMMQRGARPAPADVVLVDIDQTSIDDLGGRPRIPRRWLARAVTFLHRAGARAIGVNLQFFLPSTFGRGDDLALAAAFRDAGNVVIDEDLAALNMVTASGVGATGMSLDLPINVFLQAHVHVGLDNVPVDGDGFFRAADLLQDTTGGVPPQYHVPPRFEPSFAVELASVAEHRSTSRIVRGLPTTGMLINYLGSQTSDPLPEYQFEGLARDQDALSPFHNKIVIVQYSAPLATSLFPTPVGLLYPGSVQANILATILDHDPIRPAGDPANDLIVFVLALLTAIAATRFPLLWSMLTAVLLGIVYVVISALLFRHFNLWIELISPLVAVAICFVVGSALRMRIPGQLAFATN
jgi:CHASE2 domain-containing sensor protein